MNSNSDSTFYPILVQIQIQIQILSYVNTNRIRFDFRFTFEYQLDFEDNRYPFALSIISDEQKIVHVDI